MGRIIDVSLGISPRMLTWPGDPGVEVEPRKRIATGDAANVSELRLGSHTGTHVDPPVHFVEGADAIDALPLDVFYGPAVVVDLTAVDAIGAAELAALDLPEGTERVLCKTRNSEIWRQESPSFVEDYVAVTADGAGWLLDHGVRLVGVDFLSVERSDDGTHPVHETLLGAGTIIVEGLRLTDVEPGEYTFVCLPLRILDGDGAPARAGLIR